MSVFSTLPRMIMSRTLKSEIVLCLQATKFAMISWILAEDTGLVVKRLLITEVAMLTVSAL